jgi:hypothetical protein
MKYSPGIFAIFVRLFPCDNSRRAELVFMTFNSGSFRRTERREEVLERAMLEADEKKNH